MCKCIIGWTMDPEVDGSHNSRPHTCYEYIAALEELILSGTADSTALEGVQKAHGILVDDAFDFSKFISKVISDGITSTIQADLKRQRDHLIDQLFSSGKAATVLPDGTQFSIDYTEKSSEVAVDALRKAGYAVWNKNDRTYSSEKVRLSLKYGLPVFDLQDLMRSNNAMQQAGVMILQYTPLVYVRFVLRMDAESVYTPYCMKHNEKLTSGWHCMTCDEQEDV